MKLNKNSFTAKLVKYSYSSLTKDIYELFWQTFFSYLFFPLIAIHHIFTSTYFLNDKSKFFNKILGTTSCIIYSTLLYYTIGFIGYGIYDFGFSNNLLTFICGLLVILIISLITILFVQLIYYFIKRNSNNILIEYIKAKRRKILAEIEWV